MAQTRLIQIETLYLTTTGAAGGVPCKTTVSGLDSIGDTLAGPVIIPITGPPFKFLADNSEGEGVPIVINLFRFARLSDLRSIINTVQSTNGTATVAISNGPEGSLSFECKFGTPQDPRPIVYAGEFFSSQLYDVTINLTVASIN